MTIQPLRITGKHDWHPPERESFWDYPCKCELTSGQRYRKAPSKLSKSALEAVDTFTRMKDIT